jgi:hypothetical protein
MCASVRIRRTLALLNAIPGEAGTLTLGIGLLR